MRYFRNIYFALAAFLWLPASAHCWLETVPGLEFLQCAEVTAGNHAPASDCTDCCAVEKSQYRAETMQVAIPVLDLHPAVVKIETVIAITLPDETCLGMLTAGPPESFPTRHFLSRTALPGRAPSLAS